MKQVNNRLILPSSLPRTISLLVVLLFALGIDVHAGSGRIFNVRDYGASGRKEDDARQPIQKAIDACAADGGGTVLLPPGLYTSGTLHLRSHIRIEVAAGATLFASEDTKAYDCGPIPSKAALFFGEDLEDISFTGDGIVDGQAQYEWRVDDFEQNYDHKTWMESLGKSLMRSVPVGFPKREIYPHLVWLGRCKNIRFSGLSFLHAWSWSLTLYDCQHAAFERLHIYTSLKEAVWADGIDLDGCQDVTITNCAIETGDDCVAFSSNNVWGPARVCENIKITNCRFSSASAGIKFSEGNRVGVRNIQVSHTLFNNVNRGVVFITGMGGSISDVTLSDLTINCSRFDWFWAGDGQPFRCRNFRWRELDPSASEKGEAPPGAIRHLTMRNIVAQAKGSSLFYGHPECWLEDITLENVKLLVSTDPTAPYDKAEHALDFRRVRNLKLKDVEVVWAKPSLASWKSALNLEDVKRLELDGFVARAAVAESGVPAVAMQQVTGAVIRRCRAVEGTELFLKIAGPDSQDIRLRGNDLSRAKIACQVGDEVARGAVRGLAEAGRVPLPKRK
jgi:hypothetical protein